MCGINGFIDFKQKYNNEFRHNAIHRMNNKIIYRGPDAEGIYDGSWFSMGMRRLAIIDLNSGNQPIYNEDKSIVIVFNGEIYNHRILRKWLKERGHLFQTSSDTEIIVHLYEELGVESFAKLDGMFAFSLYDLKRESIYLVRDKIGEKPIYYTSKTDFFCYASELRSIIEIGLTEKTIDKEALNIYLEYTYIPAPYSIFEDVRKLRPGYYLCISRDGIINENRYWDIKRNPKYEKISYYEAKNKLRKLLNKSVKERMDCDVPYGVFLSGGIDSGVVAALMVRNSIEPINSFTIGYEEKSYDESGNARWMAKHLGTNHHEHILSYKDCVKALSSVVGHFDEPFADSSAIPVYLVSKYASQYVKVVLTGDAGDEMFLGYDKYAVDYYANKYRHIPQLGRKLIEKTISVIPDKTSISRKVNKVIKNAYEDVYTKRSNLMKLGFKSAELYDLLLPEYLYDGENDIVKDYFNSAPRKSELSRTQYSDIKIVLEGDMLTKVDRMTMFNSLESRTPMLASNIVDFAYNIPNQYKLDGKNKKKILKESFTDLLPKGYDKLPKSGFGVPVDYWFRNEMKQEMLDLFSPDRLKKQGIFNPVMVAKIVNEHLTGAVNRKSELWCLFVFERWLDSVI